MPIGAVKGGDQDERSSSRVKLGLSILREFARVAMNKPIQEDTTKAASAQKTRKSSECLRRGAGRRTTKSEIRDNILSNAACGTRLS